MAACPVFSVVLAGAGPGEWTPGLGWRSSPTPPTAAAAYRPNQAPSKGRHPQRRQPDPHEPPPREPGRREPRRRQPDRFAARVSGLASGLALAVRPAGLAEAPGSTARRRRVPRSGMRSTVEAGGASPDNERRTGPVAVTPSRLLARLARACRPGRGTGGRGSGMRRGPQAAGHRGAVRGSRRVRRACVRRTRRQLPPRNGETPGEPPAAHGGSPWPLIPSTARAPPRCSRPGPSGPARRRCALESG
jgi:hypothetical protein